MLRLDLYEGSVRTSQKARSVSILTTDLCCVAKLTLLANKTNFEQNLLLKLAALSRCNRRNNAITASGMMMMMMMIIIIIYFCLLIIMCRSSGKSVIILNIYKM